MKNTILSNILYCIAFGWGASACASVAHDGQRDNATQQMNIFQRRVAQYKGLYTRYQKCKKSGNVCTAQEIEELEQDLQRVKKQVIAIGVGIIGLVIASTSIYFILRYIKQKKLTKTYPQEKPMPWQHQKEKTSMDQAIDLLAKLGTKTRNFYSDSLKEKIAKAWAAHRDGQYGETVILAREALELRIAEERTYQEEKQAKVTSPQQEIENPLEELRDIFRDIESDLNSSSMRILQIERILQ